MAVSVAEQTDQPTGRLRAALLLKGLGDALSDACLGSRVLNSAHVHIGVNIDHQFVAIHNHGMQL